MNNKYSKIFESVKIGNLEIPNRYFMAPIGAMGLCDSNGAYNNKGIDYYVERAKGGVGLIITGVTKVEQVVEKFRTPSIAILPANPVAFKQSAKILTERVHAYNTKIFLQLGVGYGRSILPQVIKSGANAVAPSEVENRWDPNIKHRALTLEEVEMIVKSTAEGALTAKNSGFDGVEIHAVHEGYLLDQFATELFNQRTDKYGGSFENRYRFAVEIVQAIKKLCGKNFPVSLRYSAKSFIKDIRQGGLPGEDFVEKGRDIEEGIKAAKYLVDNGYDALNVDAGAYDSWYWSHPPMYFNEGMYLPFAQMVKKVVNVPVMVAGRMDNPDLALQALEDGSADMIGLGRPLLADASIPKKVRMNQVNKIRPCLSCHDGCLERLEGTLPISCAVNPACGREKEYSVIKADIKKKVMIVGGGVAGMEAARVCALRGHEVTLFEKTDRLGGSLIPGGMPEFKQYDHKLIKWYGNEMKDYNINVIMNKSVSKEMIAKSDYDTVLVATGATPINLKIKGSEKNNVYNAIEVALDVAKAGNSVVIVGAGLVGAEMGLWLAKKGKRVTIVELSSQILGGEDAMCFANYDMLKDLLRFNKVKIMTETCAEEVTEKGIKVRKDGKVTELPANAIITAIGYRSDNALFNEIKDMDKDTYLLGDAKNVHNIMYAIWDAYELACNI
jgi:2-enoate reductase